MVRSSVALSIIATAFVAVDASTPKPTGPKTVPGAYIVEFDEGANQNTFRAQAEPEYETRMEFNYELFKGVSIQLNESDTAEDRAAQLASLPAVKSIWPVRLYERPTLIDAVAPGNSSENRVVERALHKRQPNGTSDGNAPHVMTQVDRLHAEGITGKGVKIAVIDSGIDYHHPALGGCFGEGCVVAFGHDLVGDDYDGDNDPVPDDDPDSDCDGHGTHVAGIISATGETPYGFGGAAPGAILGAYRVFGCGGGVTDEVLIRAFNMAYEDGADIITSSIGGQNGWSANPWAASVSRIVEKGVPCTLAAGNYGETLFLSSAAADGKGVTAVASFQNTNQPLNMDEGFYTVNNGSRESFPWSYGYPEAFDGVKRELWVTGYDLSNKNDACELLPEDTPDLSDYYVLIRRSSECTALDQAVNIASKGARFFILYNDRDLMASLDVEFYEGTENILGAAVVTRDVGESWVKRLEAGSTITAEFEHWSDARDLIVIEKNRDDGGAPSIFSSWGPTFELDLKPQFGAPGGNIISTFPVELGSFMVVSGTSMATPFAAAAYALIAEARGVKPEPLLFEHLLASTAKPHVYQPFNKPQEDWLAPAVQQGAGLIQVYDAAYAKSHLEPSSLSFNDTANFAGTLNFTVFNDGDTEIVYEVTHNSTYSWYSLAEDEVSFPWPGEHQSVAEHAELTFSAPKVTISPGDSANIAVTAIPPEGLNEKRYPYWSGYITVKGSDGSSLSLPYQGLSGSLYDAFMTPEDETTMISGDDGPFTANMTFTLPNPEGEVPEWPEGAPFFTYEIWWGSPYSTLDIVQVSSNGSKTIGQIPGHPKVYYPPTFHIGQWLGQLASGEYAPPGLYQLVLRILKITGDKSKAEDWVVVESLPFNIKYAEASE